jgi:hypothetical protein
VSNKTRAASVIIPTDIFSPYSSSIPNRSSIKSFIPENICHKQIAGGVFITGQRNWKNAAG